MNSRKNAKLTPWNASSTTTSRARKHTAAFALVLAFALALTMAALGWADPQNRTDANNNAIAEATSDVSAGSKGQSADTGNAEAQAPGESGADDGQRGGDQPDSAKVDGNAAQDSEEGASDAGKGQDGESDGSGSEGDNDDDNAGVGAESDAQDDEASASGSMRAASDGNAAALGASPAAANDNAGSRLLDMLETDDAYLTHFAVGEVLDGTGPFDADSNPGNDANDHNRIVRTFDTVTYYLDYATKVYSEGTSYKEGYLWFEATLPVSKDKAVFDTDAMGWMSTDAGYMWEVVDNGDSQTLRCAKKLEAQTADAAAFPGQGQVYITTKIGSMQNGDNFRPTFSAWVDHNTTDGPCPNESTYTKGDHDETKAHNSVNGGNEVYTVQAPNVKVSAAPKYNVQIKQVGDGYVYEQSTFDFSTGDETASNKGAGNIDGRMVAYGITLQLFNDNPDKGLKGIEIPQGPISFDMKISSTFKADDGNVYDLSNDPTYRPLMWSGGEHDNAVKQDRPYGNVYTYAPFCAPQNKASDAEIARRASDGPQAGTIACYNGGDWTVTQTGDTIHFTVDGYEVNPDWFPNADWGVALRNTNTYFNPETGVTYIGGFSAGKLHVVVPFGNGNDYLPTKYSSSGSLQVHFDEGNLKATSVTGQATPTDAMPSNSQPRITDDTGDRNVLLLAPGNFRNYIQYTYGPDTTYTWRRDVNNVPDFFTTGEDALPIGSEVGIMWGINCNPYGTASNSMKGVDMLLKFDDAALEFNPKEVENGGAAPNGLLAAGVYRPYTTFLFAAKRDGSGWNHNGLKPADAGYDDEMAAARIEDLVYYDSYEELVSDGKTCVGIVASYRDNEQTCPRSNGMLEELRNKAWFTVKNDQAVTKGVYEILEVSNVWIFDSHSGDVPALLDAQVGGTAKDSYNDGRIYFDKTADNPDGVPYHTDAYTKAVYDANGGYQGGDTGGYYYGDSLYVVGYKAAILKDVAQTDTSGNPKTIYDLDFGQFTVDYRLRPSMTTEADVDMSGYATTVTLTDTLPAGVEYVGPTYYGGTYTPSERPGRSGTVEGGTEIAPTITENDDGTTTLVWSIPNVPIQRDLPTIVFKAQIDSEASANQTYKNVVTITTTEDQRPPAVAAGNMSQYSIRTAKTSDMAVTKRAEQRVSDVNSDIVYNMTWSNNGNRDYEMEVMLDAMPQDGDSRASGFSGGYDVTELKITVPERKRFADDDHAYTVFYTTDAAGCELASEDVDAAEIKGGSSGGVGWKEAPVGNDGVAAIEAGDTKKVTAWAILGPLEKKSKVMARLVMLPENNKAGDHYTNQVSIGYTGITSTTYIVNRVLRGTAWIDSNLDGERQADERRLPGVTVTAYAAEYEVDEEGMPVRGDDGRLVFKTDAEGNYIFGTVPAENLDGAVCQMRTIADDPATDENEGGTYEFANMPEGVFKVVFTKGSVNLGSYMATVTKAEGVAESVDSDGVPTYSDVGELLHSDIEGIVMPPAAELQTSPYLVQFQDAGFYPLSQLAVSKQVTGNGATDEQKEAEYTFTVTIVDEEGKEYVDEDEEGNVKPMTFPYEITGAAAEEGADAGAGEADQAGSGADAEGAAGESSAESANVPTLKSGDTFTLKHNETLTAYLIPAGAQYTVTETQPDGMVAYVANGTADEQASLSAQGATPEGDLVTVAFRNDNSVVNLQLTKKWDDDNDHLIIRPSAADFASSLKLFDGQGNPVSATPTVEDNGDSTYTVSYAGLPKAYSTGEEIVYHVREDSIPGYGAPTVENKNGSGGTDAYDGAVITNPVQRANVSVAKTVEESFAVPNSILNYTITATNTSDVDAKEWDLADTLGDNLRFVTAEVDDQASTQGAFATDQEQKGQTVSWVATIPAGGKLVIKLMAQVAQDVKEGDVFENLVTIDDPYDPGGPNPDDPDDPWSDRTNTPLRLPDVNIEKSVDKAEAKAGDYLTYTVAVSNTGSAPSLDEVWVVDPIPELTTFASAQDGGVHVAAPTASDLQKYADFHWAAEDDFETMEAWASEGQAKVEAFEALVGPTAAQYSTKSEGESAVLALEGEVADSVVWNVGILQPGQSVAVTFKVKVDQGVPAATKIDNVALLLDGEHPATPSNEVNTVTPGTPAEKTSAPAKLRSMLAKTADPAPVAALGAVALAAAALAFASRRRAR